MQNVSPLDAWTVTHVATGYTAAKLGLSLGWYFGLSVAYELIEHQMETPDGSKIFGTKRPESLINVLADLGSGVAGYKLGEL